MAFALKGAGSASTDWSITANQSSFVLTTSTTAGAANDLAVLMYAVDNNATVDGDEGAVTGVTDSAGNFWQKGAEFTNGQGTAQTGATNGIWYCNLQNALAIGATITLTFSNNTSRDAAAVSLTYFTKAAGFKAAVEGTPGTLANDAANAGSLDVTTANIACLRIRSIASETSVATAITKTAAFTAVLTQAISTGGVATTNQGVRGEYLISTGTSAASAPTGGAGTVDHASVYVAFREDAITVGDPPHNSDQVAGAQVAGFARKAVTALLITASAGLFLPPTPRVADPVQPALARAIPVLFGSSAPRARQVYYQSNFPVPYVAAVAAATPAKEGWQAPLAGAPKVASAQPGYASVPYNTAQLSVNFTNFGWHGPTSTAAPVAKAQAGFSFVPFDTRQLSVNFTNFGWHGTTATAAPVVKPQQGNSFVPLNTAQLAVNFTNLGWHPPPPPAAPVVKPQAGSSFVPYNTAQLSVNFTNLGWYAPLAGAPAVAQAIQGDSFVPSNTAQSVLSYRLALPLDAGGASPRVRQVYYQASFGPLYLAPVADTIIGIPLDIGGVAPSYRTVFHQSLFEAPYQLPPAPQGWQVPLSVAVPVAKAQVGFGFTVPFNTTQYDRSYQTAIPLDAGGAAPRSRQVYYQSNFGPLYVAPVVVAAYTNFWLQPLSSPLPSPKAQAGYAFVPLNTAQLAVNYTNFGWQQALSGAPAVARSQPGYWFVPYNTAQLVVSYTNFYFQPLSVAVPVAKAQVGFSYIPFNTAQLAVNYTDFDWYAPLSSAPSAAKARLADWSLPYTIVNAVGVAWQSPLAVAPSVTKPQPGFAAVPFYPAQPVAGIAGIAWFTPLWSVPTRNLTAPQGNASVPYNTAQIVVTTPGQRRPTLFIANVGRLMNH